MAKQPPLRGDQSVRNEIVRIAEYTVNTSTLEGWEFVNCRVIGPAIFGLLGDVSLIGCTWNAEIDALFWEISPDRGKVGVVGIIGIRDCVFSNCVFENIGIAGPPEMREMLENGTRPKT